MLRQTLLAVMCILMLASLASAAPEPVELSSQDPTVAGDSTGPAESAGPAWDENGFTPGQPEYRIPIDGCSTSVYCGPGYGSVRCVGWNTCFAYPAPDLYVVCDNKAPVYCPNSPWLA